MGRMDVFTYNTVLRSPSIEVPYTKSTPCPVKMYHTFHVYITMGVQSIYNTTGRILRHLT